MIFTAVLHYRHIPRGSTIAAPTCAKTHRFLSVRDKELRRKLTPDYDFGCKRPTFSNAYYRTSPSRTCTCRPAASTGSSPTASSPTTAPRPSSTPWCWPPDSTCGTPTSRPSRSSAATGRNLGKWWRDNRFQAYQGVSIPYFPNYLSLASPYAFSGLIFFNTMEYQMRHMDRLFGEVQRRGRNHVRGHRGGQRRASWTG